MLHLFGIAATPEHARHRSRTPVCPAALGNRTTAPPTRSSTAIVPPTARSHQLIAADARRLASVLRLFGQTVDARDAANLSVALLADGRPEAMSAAVAIERALPDQVSDVRLTPAERETVAYVVENHTRSLSKLQSLLAREQETAVDVV